MQISRHWRMNALRYRLEGVRYDNGEVSLQQRPTPPSSEAQREPQRVNKTAAQALRVTVTR